MPVLPRRPVAVDLFAGVGGMSLGFEQAGFDVAAAVEVDPIHCAAHEYNFPNTAVICDSVERVTGDRIRSAAGIEAVDVVFGGSPCQGFSMIGKRALDDPRNSLVRHFVRIVAELRASCFVFENVRGLTVGKHKAFLDELIAEFDAAGYDVLLPWKVLNAASFGVPQSRDRLFLMGCRKGLSLPSYPLPITRAAGRKGDEGLPPGPTVSDALLDIPDADSYSELVERDWVQVDSPKAGFLCSVAASHYAKRLRGLLDDPEDYSHPRLWDPSILTSSMRTDHGDVSRKRFATAEHGTIEAVSRFFKLPPDGVANTLRAGTGRDRGAFTAPRPIHPTDPRCVTVREMARLHSYPDWFRFHETKWHGARQVGNSVPPLLARAVASSIIRALGAVPARPEARLALGPDLLLKTTLRAAAARYGAKVESLGPRTRSKPHNKVDNASP